MSNKIINKRSSVVADNNPKLPQADNLEYGEIAINYADGYETLSFKNTANEVVEVKTKEYFDKKLDDTIQPLSEKVTAVENLTSTDTRANVLWIGTSIPAGDIQFSNNGTTQSITSNLGSNNYPKMVADALGFNLYNNSRGASFVCFYPSSDDGTSNWAGKDWTSYQNEVHKGYSLSATMAQV
jgi:hypothetical protein